MQKYPPHARFSIKKIEDVVIEYMLENSHDPERPRVASGAKGNGGDSAMVGATVDFASESAGLS